MPSRQFLEIPNWVIRSLQRFLGVFTHYYSLNPRMCQLGCGMWAVIDQTEPAKPQDPGKAPDNPAEFGTYQKKVDSYKAEIDS
ncbi:hypothetical protein N0Y54_29725, partial [Nostoc punctiforme UO1]|uniref:hypothetical protein n=1 Tax=Nostoc punctiforme TaxID=272131 RepID=UPI00309855DC